jgi:uncharacterized radical SAM superfamily Fe-S cluster-containing enzyme
MNLYQDIIDIVDAPVSEGSFIEEAELATGIVQSVTESVCPVCLARIPAKRVAYGEDVYLEKDCPQHGFFRTIIWRGSPSFSAWVRPKLPAFPQNPFTKVEKGCPHDCGLCPEHRQQPCCVLLDVTQACDLGCPICFADAGKRNLEHEPTIAEIETWYRKVLLAGGPFNIQLSGGEPSLRDDLPQIIALGKSLGYSFFQLNTNGLRIAREIEFLQKLKEAGLCTVYLQFDGTNDEIYRSIRGKALFAQKQQAIENCEKVGLGVILVPTLVPGINTQNIGDILRFGIEHSPTVRGVHFQPISYIGRYPTPPKNEDRFTLPEVISAIEAQSQGCIKKESFIPPGGENALCSFHANFILMPDGELKALTHHNSACCCQTPEPAGEGAIKSRLVTARHWSAPKVEYETTGKKKMLGAWDDLLARATTYKFSISGMVFQDAWNLDLERVKDCYIMQMSRDANVIPFCAYNLTNSQGEALYRGK